MALCCGNIELENSQNGFQEKILIKMLANCFNHSFSVCTISDGSLILGASGLSGRYWAGSLWFYEDPSNAPEVEKCSAGVQTEAGVTDIEWIDESRIAVASDSGKKKSC